METDIIEQYFGRGEYNFPSATSPSVTADMSVVAEYQGPQEK